MIWETVIGLETHVELATKTKIFCGCTTAFGGAPNTHCCPVCTGMPGTLPVLNRRVLEFAVKAGLALNCRIARHSRFDRKNYFYPDLPKAYQISQLYLPIARDGAVDIHTAAGDKTIHIHELHMEEDAGKLVHDPWLDQTRADYNRCGVPLIEIVTQPDFRTAEEVIAYLEKLKETLVYLGVSDCKMQEGSLRCDVNLSVRPLGSGRLGTRTEMKNLNSFKAIARAIGYEARRQIELIEQGGRVVQQTRRWDENKDATYAMRSKEDAQDYRYFPDPDLVPVSIDDAFLEEIRARQPEFRTEKMERYRSEYHIPDYDIEIITGSKSMADIFEATVALGAQPKKVSNWLMGETIRLLKERELDPEDIRFSPEHLAKLIALAESKAVNSTVAKEVFELMFEQDMDPEAYVEEKGLKMVSDTDALRRVVEEVIAANPKSVEDYRGGKDRAIGFLVGQTMKAMKGKADPVTVDRLLREML